MLTRTWEVYGMLRNLHLLWHMAAPSRVKVARTGKFTNSAMSISRAATMRAGIAAETYTR